MYKTVLKVCYSGNGCTEEEQVQNSSQFIRGLKEATGLSFSTPGGYSGPIDGKLMVRQFIETDLEDAVEQIMKYGSRFGDRLNLRVDQYNHERKMANYEANCD